MTDEKVYYKKVLLEQLPGTVEGLTQLLNKLKPDKIVEFGSGRGGLTLLFANWAKDNKAAVLAFDHKQIEVDLTSQPAEFRCIDFTAAYPIAEEWLHDCRVGLIVCNGGRSRSIGKLLQTVTTAPWLKPGWVLIAHDYLHPHEGGGLTEEQGIGILDFYNCQPYLKDVLCPLCWFSMIKNEERPE